MRAKHFLASTTAEYRVKIWFKNVFKPLVAKAAVSSKAVVLMLLISC